MKVLFCPLCGNMLFLVGGGDDDDDCQENYFSCRLCNYKSAIDKPIKSRTYYTLKPVDEIRFDGDNWEKTQWTETRCPKCERNKANFLQFQTRGADEAATIFYKCCATECGFIWKHD